MTLTRAQELWIARFLAVPDWRLPEALLWVAYRSPREVAERLEFGSSPIYSDPPTVARATCHLIAQQEGSFETEPGAALEVALLSGAVQAFADFADRSNGARRWPIRKEEWLHIEYRDSTGQRGPDVVVNARDQPRGSRSNYGLYVNVGYDRDGMMAAFEPAPDHEADSKPQAHMTARSRTNYTEERRLKGAAAALRASGRAEISVRGLARMMALNELGQNPEPRQFAKRTEAIRGHLKTRLDARDLERLSRSLGDAH